ncbi:MAG: TolC family protein [Pseudomonadota bacterium]
MQTPSRTPSARRAAATLIAAFVLAVAAPPVAALDLEEAEALALERDPELRRLRAEAEGEREAAVAAGAWPDPRVSLGADSLPVDTFALDQEPMTRLSAGISQTLPRGDTADQRRLRGEARARAREAAAEARRRAVRQGVREDWVELAYRRAVVERLASSQQRLAALADLTEDRFRQGQEDRAAVLEAELEVERLADRQRAAQRAVAVARAELAEWLGEAADRADAGSWPAFPEPGPATALGDHPQVAARRAEVAAAEGERGIAEAGYHPQWAVSLGYGYRVEPDTGPDRPDFLSLGVSFDLPLFTGDRQDRDMAAARAGVRAGQARVADTRRQLERRLAVERASLDSLNERDTAYREDLLPRARERREAARDSYRSDAGTAYSVLRAEIALLEAETNHLAVRRDALRARAAILFLLGAPS